LPAARRRRPGRNPCRSRGTPRTGAAGGVYDGPVGCDRQLIYDVGAHRGEDSAYYLALGYRVVGFEANPELAEHCRRRFAREIHEGRFTIVEGAIAADAGETVSFFQHENSVFGTTGAAWSDRNRGLGTSRQIEVAAVSFAASLERFGVPYFLKVDIEGADRLCLDELREGTGRPRYVSLESEKADFSALVEEFDLLAQLGYDRFAVVQQAGISRIANATRLDGKGMPFAFETDASGPFGPDVGPWVTRDEALARYRRIFTRYRYLGDHSWMRRSSMRRKALVRIGHVLRTPVPGWYDTHATRSDL